MSDWNWDDSSWEDLPDIESIIKRREKHYEETSGVTGTGNTGAYEIPLGKPITRQPPPEKIPSTPGDEGKVHPGILKYLKGDWTKK